MKKSVFILIALFSFTLFAFTLKKKNEEKAKIKWITIEEAEKLSKKNPKKLLVDVYTTWCHWCKEMDKSTFSDAKVVDYVSKNFYAVKFNAEGNDTIKFNNQTFVNPGAPTKTRATHQLAMAIGSQNGRIGYPTISYLDEKNQVISVVPGFLPADQFLIYLKYINEGAYKTQSADEYFNSQSSK